MIKKNKSTKIPNSKSQVVKDENFEVKKKEIKKVKSIPPQIEKKINKNKFVTTKGNIFNEKPSMSAIPNPEKFRSVKLNQKFYGCSKSQRSKIEKKNKKDSFVNKNITISNLLGYFYSYDPHYINISNLLKNDKRINPKNINISELLNMEIENIEYCN